MAEGKKLFPLLGKRLGAPIAIAGVSTSQKRKRVNRFHPMRRENGTRTMQSAIGTIDSANSFFERDFFIVLHLGLRSSCKRRTSYQNFK